MNHRAFVWDILVRITHWGVAAAVLANLFVTPPGENVHQVLGYVAAALVAVRLLWSLTAAKKPARFRDLLPTPGNALHHLRDLQRGEDTAEQYHQYSFAEPRQYQRGNCSGGGASRVSRCGQHIGEDQSAQNGKGYIVKE